jgi:WD40 repeat protein/serine/threonine protein kinase
MTGRNGVDSDNGASDPVVADLVEDLANRLQAGESLDLEAVIREHPAQADRLRRLLPAVRALADFGSSGGSAPASNEGEPVSGVLGDFRIVGEVGRGGMGVVYEAEQISLGRRVALKVLPFAATMDPRHLQRFHNEARAAASLEHPHIVPVYGVGCERGVHYYAMKFIDGQSLARLIQAMRHPSEPQALSEPRPSGSGAAEALSDSGGSDRTAPMAALTTQLALHNATAFRQIAEWGIQAAEALENAHSVGIVHRDIKPANLMIDSQGALWVTDFGLARTAVDAGLTMTGDVLGTLRYMSPEQALAKHGLVDHRTDVYSLGVTLYEVLTGTPAVHGNDREQILNAITLDEPRPLRRLDPAIPHDLETIVLKAIATGPNERYATAKDLANDLRRFLEYSPIRARRPSLLARTAKWLRRHKGLVGAALAFLVLLVIVLGVSIVLIAGERAEALWQRDTAKEQEARAVEQAAIARARLYAADIGLAYRAWENEDLRRARELLAHHIPKPGEPDLRGFEWYYLARLARGMDLPNGGGVCHVAFSPDGQLLASADHDGQVAWWDTMTGEMAGVCRGHKGEANWVCFSPDGCQLASAGDDGTVRLWDVASRKQVRVFGTANGRAHAGEAVAVVFLADGSRLASGGDDKVIKLWDVKTGERLYELRGHTGRIECLALSPDAKTLASASGDRTVRLWDLATRRAVTLVHDGTPTALAFAPGRAALAVGCRWPGGEVAVWDLTKFRKLAVGKGYGNFESVTFLDDNRIAAGHEQGKVIVWDLRRPKAERSWVPHTKRIWSLAFSPERGLMASGAEDGFIDLRPWPAPVPRETLERAHPARVTAIGYSPDGNALAVGRKDRRVVLIDTARGKRQGEFSAQAPVSALAFDPQGAMLGNCTPARHAQILGLAGRRLVAGLGEDGAGRAALVLYAGGFRLAFNGADGAMQVWELAPGQDARPLCRGIPNARVAGFSPDGRLLATGNQGYVRLWDAATGSPRAVMEAARSWISCLAFSPDGKWLVAGSESDGQLRSWHTATGQPRLVFCERGPPVFTLAFSPDGKTLASAGTNDGLRLWSAATGQELFALRVPNAQWIGAVAFAPDGRSLAAGVHYGQWKNEVMVWRARPGKKARH